jgi:hypoxia up-regulated 1
VHRYSEKEAFPQTLNNSQMWNWSTRLFLTEARQNLTAEMEADLPSKWTKDELDGLEKTLKEHESWLNTWVEKQKSVKANQDPVIETTEMKARAKVLETHLQKLWKRKVPKAKKTTTTSAAATSTSTTAEAESTSTDVPVEEQDGQQVPIQEDHRDEL